MHVDDATLACIERTRTLRAAQLQRAEDARSRGELVIVRVTQEVGGVYALRPTESRRYLGVDYRSGGYLYLSDRPLLHRASMIDQLAAGPWRTHAHAWQAVTEAEMTEAEVALAGYDLDWFDEPLPA